jgi:hypothetical protein
MAKTIMELPAGEDSLMAPGQVLDELQIEKFIKPNLEVLGKRTVVDARIYPSPGFRYLLPTERGSTLGFEGRAGQIAKALTKALQPGHVARTSYVRTHNLQRNWERILHGQAEYGGEPLQEEIKNLADYAGYVMGAKQPYTWKFGWRRLTDIMEKLLQSWVPEMERKAQQLWDRKL